MGHELTAATIRGAESGRPATRGAIEGRSEELEVDGLRFELVYPGPLRGTGGLPADFGDRRVLFVGGPKANAREHVGDRAIRLVQQYLMGGWGLERHAGSPNACSTQLARRRV